MFFRQVLHEDLGCASYVVADGGEAAVVDPKWEIEDYLELAEEHGFAIAHVLETHNHADHVSGRGRLADATGATIHAPRDAGAAYAHEPLAEGDAVAVGRARVRAVATPGHRPEHTAFLVEDTARAGTPWLLLTGDSLFVGDVARPDLAVDAEEGARGIYRSLRRILELDDFVEVWPGHIGGSLCGGPGTSEKPSSTVGFERRFNPFLAIGGEDAFVRAVTSTLAPQPPNFERIVELNRGPLVTAPAIVEPLAPRRVRELLDQTATLLDGREPREHDAAHVPGSISVTTAKGAVGTRAAWVVDAGTPVVVTAAGDDEAVRMARMLEAAGFRKLRGYLAGGLAAWEEAGLELETTAAVAPLELAERLQADEVALLDVRERGEWRAGHVPGSIHLPYHELREGVPRPLRRLGKPLAVACSAGNRSAVAASLLRRAGVDDVVHVVGGGVQDLAEAGIGLVEGD